VHGANGFGIAKAAVATPIFVHFLFPVRPLYIGWWKLGTVMWPSEFFVLHILTSDNVEAEKTECGVGANQQLTSNQRPLLAQSRTRLYDSRNLHIFDLKSPK
jgi:hypothetical protein